MHYKMTLTDFSDWLNAWLRVNCPHERFYVQLSTDADGDGLSYTWRGGVIDFPVRYVTPDFIELSVNVIPYGDNFPQGEAEQHAEALRAAIDKRFRGVSAIPDEPQAGACLDDWFQWRKDCAAVGVTIRLNYIAKRTGYARGTLRNKHSEWKAQNA